MQSSVPPRPLMRRRWSPGRAGFAIVRGQSMMPLLAAGDRVWVRYGVEPGVGKIAIVRFPEGVLAIKRLTRKAETYDGRSGWWVSSDNPDVGVDSRHRGVIADADIVGLVGARVWPRPRRL